MDEKDFIQDRVKKDPYPLFFYFFLLLVIIGGLFWIRSIERGIREARVAVHPELRVTNGDIQLFLWQHPQFMRVHMKRKSGYLPAFSPIKRGELDPDLFDQLVQAPPELLFRYHRWNDLVGDVLFSRVVSPQEWKLFFEENPAWESVSDASRLNQAFVGWRNYFYEGEAINNLPIHYKDVRELIRLYPGFGVEKWHDLEPDYNLSGKGLVPTGTLPSFVRVAIFNTHQQ